jgi:hypothetical protein
MDDCQSIHVWSWFCISPVVVWVHITYFTFVQIQIRVTKELQDVLRYNDLKA